MAEAPTPRGQHLKSKPAPFMGYTKYKTGVNKFGQMLPYFLFQRNSVKWEKKINRNLPLELFYELVA
jgi:hypothetical protein